MISGSSVRFRVYTLAEFHAVLTELIAHFGAAMRAHRSRRVSKAFAERIMLAVTQVNGCRYCNYYHANLALAAGISNQEVQSLMQGELSDAPADEQVALLFAQHYADTKGHPEPESCARLREVYGDDMADDILAYIRMIMFGNVYGILFDSLWFRLQGKPVAGSSLWQESAGFFGIVLMAPFIAVQYGMRRRLAHSRPESAAC